MHSLKYNNKGSTKSTISVQETQKGIKLSSNSDIFAGGLWLA